MFRRERAPDEGESQMSPPTPARRPWTADERKKLDDLKKAGKTCPAIAAALQRTPQSIYSQLQRLDIKQKKAAHRVVQIGLKAKGAICGFQKRGRPVGRPF